jgi:hypothetical protein
VLNLDETGEKTYFEKMDDKLSNLKIFVEQNIQKVHDRLDSKLEEIQNLTFAFEQKVEVCMHAREIAEKTKEHHKMLTEFTKLQHQDLTSQINKTNKALTDHNIELQVQITN